MNVERTWQIHQPFLTRTHPIQIRKDQGISLEEEIENGIHERQIQTCEQHDALPDEHPHRSRQCHFSHLLQVASVFDVELRYDLVVACFLAKLSGAALEDYRTVCLRQQEDPGGSEAIEAEIDPKDPSPADSG